MKGKSFFLKKKTWRCAPFRKKNKIKIFNYYLWNLCFILTTKKCYECNFIGYKRFTYERNANSNKLIILWKKKRNKRSKKVYNPRSRVIHCDRDSTNYRKFKWNSEKVMGMGALVNNQKTVIQKLLN